MLGELARQQAEQHPIPGDERLSTLHYLLALLMVPRSGARRLLTELGLDLEEVVQRIEQEGARRVNGEDTRPEELPVEGWVEFRVTDQQDQVIRRRFQAVQRQLRRQGVRYMFGKNMDDPEWLLVRIHPGASGLDPREVLDRLLGRAS
jgi:hypothetical protein